MSKAERVEEPKETKAPKDNRAKQVSVRLTYEEERMVNDILHAISGQNAKAKAPDVMREALRFYWTYKIAPDSLSATEKAYIEAGLLKAAGEQIIIEGADDSAPYQVKPEWAKPEDLLPATCAFCGLMMNNPKNILVGEDKRVCRCFCDKCGHTSIIGIKPDKKKAESHVPILDKPLNDYVPVTCQRCGNRISDREAFIYDYIQGGPGTNTVQVICPLCHTTTLVGRYPAGWKNPTSKASTPQTNPTPRPVARRPVERADRGPTRGERTERVDVIHSTPQKAPTGHKWTRRGKPRP